MEDRDLDARLKKLERAERSIDDAFSTGKAERSEITRMAQLDAAEAVALVGVAMESDEVADEAMKIAVIAEGSGDRDRIRAARKKEREARKQANADHRAATRSAKQAYDAIKFSAPNKMGFMRAVQIGFAFHIAFQLIFLVITSRDAFTYNVGSIMDWVVVILEGMAFWMFLNRYKIARPFVIGMSIVALVVPAIADMVNHSFSLGMFIVNGMFYLFLIPYFLFSKRVKATLVNDLSWRRGHREGEEFVIKRRGWPFVRNLGMYFVVFSVLGHWMEMAMCQLIIAGLVEGEYDPTNTMLWRDWLYPFPMEGMAVVLIALILYPLFTELKRRISNRVLPYVLSFLANALTCSIIEFGMGMAYNSNHELWDYSENFGNIMGQVCLQNAVAFGVACSVIAWFVYPTLERWISRMPQSIMNIVFAAVMVFGGIIFSLYIVEPSESLMARVTENPVTNTEQSESIDGDIAILELGSESLHTDLESRGDLTPEQKKELEEQAKKLDELIDSMQETLGEAA